MKINRVDVAHDEIKENCEEYLLVSAEKFEDDYFTRLYVQTNGEILKEIILSEMLQSKKFANFVQEVINEYNQLN